MDKMCMVITIWKGRAHLLRKSLDRLCTLSLPDELLIINDGGDEEDTNTLLQVIGEFIERLPIYYIYTYNPGLTMCSHARNVAINNTGCELIISTEPEIAFVTDVVKQLYDYSQQYPTDCINTGCIHRIETDIEMTENILTNLDNYPFYKRTGWTGNAVTLYRRQWLLDINGWDEEFPRPYGVDDCDLNERLLLTGHNLLTMDDIIVIHQYHPKEDFGSNIQPNLDYAHAKGIEHNLERVVANRNHQWGIIKHR